MLGLPSQNPNRLKHFRDSKGVSPMRYLCDARFEKVREALARAQPGDSVTTIAMSWGFSHLGRFSVEYRRRFGESPSDTLKRRRRFILGAEDVSFGKLQRHLFSRSAESDPGRELHHQRRVLQLPSPNAERLQL